MSIKTGVNAPKTPVTAGSQDIAPVTLPNVCKMPGPPAPFVPTPLPNIGKSELSPKDYTTSVKIEGKAVAIRGASYESIGDVASKGTGGGLISCNTHGPTKFIGPGSMNVKMQGKNVHLLGEPMLNNCGPSGSPPNTGSTTPGNIQPPEVPAPPFMIDLDCEKKMASGKPEDKCDVEEMCAMVKGFNESKLKKQQVRPSPSNRVSSKDRARIKAKFNMNDAQIDAHNSLNNRYGNGLKRWARDFKKLVTEKGKDSPEVQNKFTTPCRHKQWSEAGGTNPPLQGADKPGGLSPDHVHDAGQGGPVEYADIKDGLKWASSSVNQSLGTQMKQYDPAVHGDTVGTAPACQCP